MVMGNTHYSVAAVLTTFMGGLALGSILGGRIADKFPKPIRLYGVLEVLIGLSCILVPYLIDWSLPALKWIYANYQGRYLQASFFRFLVSSFILIVPTVLMGATLPVISRFFSRNDETVGQDAGLAYAANTFGAVAGALGSAFIIMPALGLQKSIWLAAGVNLIIGFLVLVLFRNFGNADSQEKEETLPSNIDPIQDKERFWVLLAFGFSGISAMIYQVAWNRVFSLVLGSSVYAFSLIVTAFILGLALGAAVYSRFCSRIKDLKFTLGGIQIGIGMSSLLVLPLFALVPFINRWGYQKLGVEFETVQSVNFGIIFSFIFIPTFLMGAQFPVVIKTVSGGLTKVGKTVASAYSSNTIGAIVGSFIGGFLLVPFLGLEKSIFIAALLNVVLGILLIVFLSRASFGFKSYVLPTVLLACYFAGSAFPKWDKAIISSGSYMPYRIKDLDEAVEKNNKILFYREGMHATVTTELSVSGNIFLRVNGKTDASLALDMRTQLLSGYLPMLLRPNSESALVIGMGSGITAGAVERFPLKKIDLVEISKTVVEGASFFGPFSHFAMEDPRLKLILEDGRNHVALTEEKYDVIISEPSNPWISGIGALFTREFFELTKNRLNPDGVVCIWVHTNMSPSNFKSIVKTFNEAFSTVTMWESIVGDDYLLIGSNSPYKISYERVLELFEDPAAKEDLESIGIYNIIDLMSLMIMPKQSTLEFSKKAPVHTDDDLSLEFQAPKYLYKDDRGTLVRQISPFFKIDPDLVEFEELDKSGQEEIIEKIKGLKRSESQMVEIKRKAQIDSLLEKALTAFGQSNFDLALSFYSEILTLDPKHLMTFLNQGNVYSAMGKHELAEIAYTNASEINPYYLFSRINLVKTYLAAGKASEAEKTLKDVLTWHSTDPEVFLYLGLAYSFQKEVELARKSFEEALKLDPRYSLAHYYLGVHYMKRNRGKAQNHLRKFINLEIDGGDEKLIQNAERLLKKL